MKRIFMILSICSIACFFSCENEGREFAESDKEIETDPEDYDRGMREEEAAPAEEMDTVSEEDVTIDEK